MWTQQKSQEFYSCLYRPTKREQEQVYITEGIKAKTTFLYDQLQDFQRKPSVLCLTDEICKTSRAVRMNADEFIWMIDLNVSNAIKAQAQFHLVAGTGAPPLYDQDSEPA